MEQVWSQRKSQWSTVQNFVQVSSTLLVHSCQKKYRFDSVPMSPLLQSNKNTLTALFHKKRKKTLEETAIGTSLPLPWAIIACHR
jgi:hypothetical protein